MINVTRYEDGWQVTAPEFSYRLAGLSRSAAIKTAQGWADMWGIGWDNITIEGEAP